MRKMWSVILHAKETKEHQYSPTPGRGKEGFSPRIYKGVKPCQHLISGLWPPELSKCISVSSYQFAVMETNVPSFS
jgi:hypothetical protein